MIHNVALVDRPSELLSDYAAVMADDRLARRNAAQPGVACFENDVARNPRSSARLAAYLGKWRIANALACHQVDPLTGLATAVALWRERPEAVFTEEERKFFECAMPHLIETYGTNRIVHMARSAYLREKMLYASASVDPAGRLQVAPPDFQRLLQAEWPDWRGIELPAPARRLLSANGAAGAIRRPRAGSAARPSCRRAAA